MMADPFVPNVPSVPGADGPLPLVPPALMEDWPDDRGRIDLDRVLERDWDGFDISEFHSLPVRREPGDCA